MEVLLAEQKVVIKSITNALNNFKKIGKAYLTYGIVRNRLQNLKTDYTCFKQNHAKILASASDEFIAGHKYFIEDKLSACEAAYYAASDYMADWEAQLEPQSSSTPDASSVSQRQQLFSPRSALQLPRINLPRFSGNLSAWESFRDQFKALIIENSELVNVNRLQYLNSCLKDEVFDIVRNFALTDANFTIAWDLLIARYDNKRRLVHEHIHSLVTLPQLNSESAAALATLRDKSNIAIKALANLGRAVDTWDDILVYLIIQRFDKATRKAWELHIGDTSEYPSFEKLEQFLASRIRALENMLPSNASGKSKTGTFAVQNHTANTNNVKCPLCQKPHFLYSCPDFRNKALTERREFAQKLRCCFNCLSTRHNRKTCQSKSRCRQCQQNHHSLLHDPATKTSTHENIAAPSTSNRESTTVAVNNHVLSTQCFSKSSILLATASVTVCGPAGRRETVPALLDQGSVTSLISERVAQRLRLKRTRVSVSISGIGGSKSSANQAAHMHISPRHSVTPKLPVTALILKTLTAYIPPRRQALTKIAHLQSLQFADENPTSSEPIDVVIGADLYGSILLPGVKSGAANEPIAQHTIFGWILSGSMPPGPSSGSPVLAIQHCIAHEEISALLRKFWEIEEVPQQHHTSIDEARCDKHFTETHTRDSQGRYIVRLPFKTGPPLDLGTSRSTSLAAYKRSEFRLKAHPAKAAEYHDFLQEYEQLGHMRKVSPPNESTQQTLYIPHHAVIRTHSATTRLRVVFNASAPTSNGTSLNDHLLIGSKLQLELPSILTRWRQFRYVYIADIAKMYRQIRIDERDVNYQRIFWRPSVDSPIEDYCLLTVTYGIASAPYLALRVLKQLSIDEGADFPLAVPVLQQHLYVDDCVFGADDIPLAQQTRNQLTALLGRAGFRLRKWTSNHPVLLTGIDPQDHGLARSKSLQADDSLKVLGITWNPALDVFQVEIIISSAVPATKRAVLSTIATVFDPIGWLTPDENLPDKLSPLWQSYYKSLPLLRKISIPRWTGDGLDSISAELHGFADASTVAYGAVTYLKLIKLDGSVQIALLFAKSKVAPLKPVSVPRLELCATVLLSRIIAFLRPLLNHVNLPCYCWTDSTVALAWLSQHPSRWKTFVANRVHEVQTQIPEAVWHHVSSQQNPADFASRGITPSDLIHSSLWWEGPPWLKLPPDHWPQTSLSDSSESILEARNKLPIHLQQVNEEWDLSVRFSSWTKLLRITAYVIRFVSLLRFRRSDRNIESSATPFDNAKQCPLRADEIKAARNFWLKTVQRTLFPREYYSLVHNHPISKHSKLIALTPYVDIDDLIHVRGRLRNSALSHQSKNPIILAPHPLVTSLIRDVHLKALHAGPQLTLARLREEFWLLRARQTIRSVLHQCIVCTREKAAVSNELMGDLPDFRVRPVPRAFYHTGIDYAGPIQIRSTPGRGHKSHKAYISVFVCMTVKATYLELVSELSTQAFLAAFARFCARRGVPSTVYSDNATNFQGAQRELTTMWHAAMSDSSFLNNIAEQGVNWKFIPPSSPHFGGLWEACVRSVKYHLKRVIGVHTLTYEEMNTLLCKIETCLNSRPLSQMSDHIDDYTALTPSHFLVGSTLTSVPEPSLLCEKEARLTRWQLVQQMRESF